MFREILKAIKAKTEKIRVAEVKEKREKARKRKEARGEGVIVSQNELLTYL